MQVINKLCILRDATVALLLTATPLMAQGPQLAEVGELLPDGFGQIIGSADYDGDGDVDLFSTSGVYLNDGGFFRPGPTLPASFDPGTNVRSAAVADFNGDGLVDVLFGRIGGTPGGLVMMTAPAGAGTAFVMSAAFPAAAAQFDQLTAADVDGDSDVDLVVDNTSLSSAWRLLLNDGAGNFSFAAASQWPTDTPAILAWMASGDFDGDGWVDMIASSTTNVFWRRNLGGGSFGPSLLLAQLIPADRGAVGDFDGDGFDDVFMVDYTGIEVVALGSPTGLLAAPVTFGGILNAPPIAADRDGDGKDELFRSVGPVSGALSNELFVRAGVTTGLGPAVSLGAVRYAFGNGVPYPGVAVFDVDGDGDQDTVVAPGGVAPYVLLQTALGPHVLAPKAVPAAFESLFAPPKDIDGDGDLDLLRAKLASGVVTLESFRNDGRGCFAATPTAAGSFSALTTAQPTWADLDGDGDWDLWTDSPFPSFPSTALFNDGSGFFSVGATVANVGHAVATVIADFDGDSVKDIVIARPSLLPFPFVTQAPVFLQGVQTPNGVTFGQPVQFGQPVLIVDMVVFDVDLDGDLDLLVATSGPVAAPGPVFAYQNDGFGGFTAMPPFAGVQATTLAVGDLNGDFFDDLVMGGVTWLRTGLTFTAQGSHAVPMRAISLADLNEDGDLDLFDDVGRWYAGDGAGNFAAPVNIVPYAPVVWAASGGGRMPADLDNDGDIDTIGPSSTRPGHFTIYSNLERHVAPTTLATPGNPMGIAVYGNVGDPWFLGLSLPTPGFVTLPPLGALFLDPATLFVAGGGVIPGGGRSDTTVTIPTNGAGFTLTWQALVGQQLRFTNAFDTPIAL